MTAQRRAIGNTIALFLLIVIVGTSVIAVIAMQGLSSSSTAGSTTTTSTTTSSPAKGSGAVFLIRVVNGPTWSPIAGMTVVAGPISSPNDVTDTPGGPTITECVHEVPNGSSVGENGTVVSNGTTITFPPCPLTEYVTNSTGWVSITDATGFYYFIKAGNANVWNDVVLGVIPNNTINLAIPLPSGNVTVPSTIVSCVTAQLSNMTSGCTSGPGAPVLWPTPVLVWPCGPGVPSGSTGTSQGFYGNFYIAYSFVQLPNGTKAVPSSNCDVGSL